MWFVKSPIRQCLKTVFSRKAFDTSYKPQLQRRGICYSSRRVQSFRNDDNDTDESSTDIQELDEEELADLEGGAFQQDYILPAKGHKVFVIQPELKKISYTHRKWTKSDYQLDEACALVESLPGWQVSHKVIKNISSLGSKHLFGKGNFEELWRGIRRGRYNTATAVFVSIQMLTGHQLVTLQQAFGLPVYDRFTIVLQIFKMRAKTREAKLQVALAEIPYYRSRLTGLHLGTLDQQGGGTAYIGGSGETFLETRRRILQEREIKIRKALDKVQKQREMLRQVRTRKQCPVVAIVGYTNAGKTSLIKALTQDASMQPLDKLFATLDVTVHAGMLANKMKVLYVDTVGFISDIPTSLIASFSATLEDVRQADLVVHVRDISHPDRKLQKKNVLDTLDSLDLPETLSDNIIEVCNKVDKLDRTSLDDDELNEDTISISATSGLGLDQLETSIQDTLMRISDRLTKCMKIPMVGDHLKWLEKEATVESISECEENPECILVNVIITPATYAKFLSRFGKPKIKRVEMQS